MKYTPFFENLVESFDYFSKRSGDKSANKFNEDMFSPAPAVLSERLVPATIFFAIKIVLLIVFFLLLIRISNLQIINGEKNLSLSDGNRIRKERIKPQRGLVLDKDGLILARNLPTFSIIADTRLCPVNTCILDPLKDLANFKDINERFEKNKKNLSPFVLASGISRDEILKLGDLNAFPYLQEESDQIRSYPYGQEFAHVLGYLGEASEVELEERPELFLGDRVGKDGVEKYYDKDLQGQAGFQLVEVDVSGSSKRFLSRKDSVNGKSLVLTISRELQEIAYHALQNSEKKAGACCGSVVVENVRTGAILALVSHPSFDPNIFSQNINKNTLSKLLSDKNLPFFNRATSGSFAPGSVFKVIVATAALSEKIITKDTLLQAPGSISLGSFTFGDWKPSGHGLINVIGALAESADTFFYQIGGGYESQKGLGPEKIANYARLFGLGQRTFIDLPEESEGLVPDPSWKEKVKGENWYLGNTYHYSIGQGDLLSTTLQISQAVSAIANGGVIFRPYILKRIEDEKGKELLEVKPSVIREKFIDSNVLSVVREGMGKAAQPGGTAYPFFNFKLKVGAKTGTAEPGGDVEPNAWFTVFAPLENPEVAVTVLVEHGGQGADVAAPVAREILDEYFKDR